MGSAGEPADVAAARPEPLSVRLAFAAAVALGLLVPVACGLARPETWPWLGAGALGWLVTVAGLKLPLGWLLDQALAGRGPRIAGTLHGLLSGLTELVAVPVTLYALGAPPSTAAILALGLGAASLEAVVVGAFAGLQRLDPGYEPPVLPEKLPWWLPFAFPVERWLIAAPGHVGSRALVAATWLGGGWGPALVALAGFTLVDGLPTALERGGLSWDDPLVLARYYTIAGGMGWLELGLGLYALAGLG